MKAKFETAIEKSFNTCGFRTIDDKLKDITEIVNTLHNQAMKEAVKKALLEGAKLGIEAVAGTIKEINKQL